MCIHISRKSLSERCKNLSKKFNCCKNVFGMESVAIRSKNVINSLAEQNVNKFCRQPKRIAGEPKCVQISLVGKGKYVTDSTEEDGSMFSRGKGSCSSCNGTGSWSSRRSM